MIDKDYIVKFITSKNSFLFLSDKDHKWMDQDLLIRLSYGLHKSAYFSLGPPLSILREGELALCPVLAKSLGIFKNDIVTLSSTSRISTVKCLNIIPDSKDDLDVLELLANDVQSTLLNQVRIVHNNQKLVIWVSNSLHVAVVIDGVYPISPGRLENFTEVRILQPVPKVGETPKVQKRNSLPKKHSILSNRLGIRTVFRLQSTDDIESAVNNSQTLTFQQPFNIFLNRVSLPICDANIDTLQEILLMRLSLIPQVYDTVDTISSLVVRLIAIEDVCNTEVFITSNIYAHKCVISHIIAELGAKVVLEAVDRNIETMKEMQIMTTSGYFSKADELARLYLSKFCRKGTTLINSDVLLRDADFAFMFKFDTPFSLIDSNFLRSCKFGLYETELLDAVQDKEAERTQDITLCLQCGNVNNLLENIETCLKLKLLNNNLDSGNILLIGKQGTGKTLLLKYVSQKLSKKPYYMHVLMLDCKTLKGKSTDSVEKVLNQIFLKLIYYQPSLLVLDDLHVICQRVNDGETLTQENIQFNKVSETIAEILESQLQSNSVSILATGVSVTGFNQVMFSSRGRHLFKTVLTVDDLNKHDRMELLRYLLESKEAKFEGINFDDLGVRTEGFVAQDLVDFADKVIFEALKDDVDAENLNLTKKNFDTALKNTSSLTLKEVHLHSTGDKDFGDVGGLEEVKKILVESMSWPAQYPNIFGRAPLRLQSGFLLYGPPGTGKTMLAGAAAKHCNMRLISIKGPELLSKYIGASEQAVRDVFQKAQSARPCMLFFDEFDSLAPRRGHDSTGVTDRVVNQFLTQLDGVESLNGVCVLAATSRPDLLDPALLRPGRLDRQIFIPIPDRETRLSILKSLSKSMLLDKDVDLNKLADETDGYTGADLQAVLYTAQLLAVEHLLGDNVEKYDSAEVNHVTQSHLDEAVRTTRPSLTRDEKLKYERIYGKFQGKTDILEFRSGKKKATLA